MKKLLLSSVLLLALSSGAVFASTSASSTVKPGIKVLERVQNIKDKIASTSERVKNLEKEVKTDIEKRIGKKLDEQRTRIANGFEEAIKNLNKLADKVDALIAKIESRGKDMSASKALLADARTKITVANTELTTLENALAQSTSTSTRKAILKQVKDQSEKTKAAIKAAHKAIVNTITSLKPGLRDDNKNAKENNSTSSTSSNSTSSNQ